MKCRKLCLLLPFLLGACNVAVGGINATGKVTTGGVPSSTEALATATPQTMPESGPARVLSSKVTYDSLGKHAVVSFANDWTTAIDGLRVEITCTDNFDEPVEDRSGHVSFIGEAQETIKVGDSTEFSWNISEYQGVSKISVRITEVHFVDGNSWKYVPPAAATPSPIQTLAPTVAPTPWQTPAGGPARILTNKVERSSGNITLSLNVRNDWKVAIDGLRYEFKCTNNFGDPAYNRKGFASFVGQSEKVIRVNDYQSISWDISEFYTATKVVPSLIEVHFVDGTTWKPLSATN